MNEKNRGFPLENTLGRPRHTGCFICDAHHDAALQRSAWGPTLLGPPEFLEMRRQSFETSLALRNLIIETDAAAQSKFADALAASFTQFDVEAALRALHAASAATTAAETQCFDRVEESYKRMRPFAEQLPPLARAGKTKEASAPRSSSRAASSVSSAASRRTSLRSWTRCWQATSSSRSSCAPATGGACCSRSRPRSNGSRKSSAT